MTRSSFQHCSVPLLYGHILYQNWLL